MRTFYILLMVVFMSVNLYAQEDGEEEKKYPDGQDRFIAELNWNYWLNAPDNIDLEWYSRGINIYGMYDIPFGNSPVSFAPGLGISTNNVYHNGQFIVTDSIGTIMKPYADSLDISNNKLNTTYIDLPLELRFRTKPDDNNWSWKLALGFKAGLLISDHTKYVGEGQAFGVYQSKVKIKKHDVPNMAQFRYGLTARIGYGPFNLVGFYGLSSLFEDGLGPNLVPVSIGLSFNGL